jgi:hypothetical protein
MARGQAQAANKQLGLTNQVAGQELGKANSLENQLIPDYTSMLNQGYTPAEESAMTTGGEGAVGSAYGAAKTEGENAAARTNNASNLTTQQDQLARDKGVGEGQLAAGLQEKFANEREANKKFGMTGLEGLYGGNQRSADQLYGLSPGLLQARATGKSELGDILGAGGAALGAFV